MRRLRKEIWPYKITVDNTTDGLEDWLIEKMGEYKGRWNAVYNYNRSDYYFRTQQDAVTFSLRWS